MNANSKPRAQSNRQWLVDATKKLQATGIPTASLDAELLLADSLEKDRIELIAHPDAIIPMKILLFLEKNLDRRIAREPLAYIRGYKEFYGRNFKVTPDTLIPRPETETFIELLKPLALPGKKLIDVGTGSGVIAIMAKLEYPELIVEATDISGSALKVAEQNAVDLHAEISLYTADLLENVNGVYDIICANLPYVDMAWQVSAETHTEPDLALYAEDGGLVLIKRLIEQTEDHLLPEGYLLLEADPRQHGEIVTFGHSHDFDWYQTDGFIVVLQKR